MKPDMRHVGLFYLSGFRKPTNGADSPGQTV